MYNFFFTLLFLTFFNINCTYISKEQVILHLFQNECSIHIDEIAKLDKENGQYRHMKDIIKETDFLTEIETRHKVDEYNAEIIKNLKKIIDLKSKLKQNTEKFILENDHWLTTEMIDNLKQSNYVTTANL